MPESSPLVEEIPQPLPQGEDCFLLPQEGQAPRQEDFLLRRPDGEIPPLLDEGLATDRRRGSRLQNEP
jgi:hypothetical protein